VIHWTGEKVLELAKVNLPGDIRQLAVLPHVQAIAERLRLGTLAELPVVRRQGRWRVVTGVDIVAAHLVLQWPQMRARSVKCTDLEADLLALTYQSDGARDEEMKAGLVAKINAVREQLLRDPPKAPPVRRRSELAQAVKMVAKITKRDDVALLRLARRSLQNEGEPSDPLPVKATIYDMGFVLPRHMLDAVSQVQMRLIGIKDGLSRAIRQIELALSQKAALPALVSELKLSLWAQRELVSSHYPRAVCPYCKLIPGVQEQCLQCAGVGWIVEAQMQAVPDKYWDREDRIVFYNGEIRRYADLLPMGAQENQ
jgi:hypothetical protein